MRVAFDIHGTLDADKKLREFVVELKKNPSIEIFIISGPPLEQISLELINLDLYFMENYKIISVVDFLKHKGVDMWQDENGWWCDPQIWWESKGLICSEYAIDFIFDDKVEYAKYMPDTTRFILWKGAHNERR